MSCSRRQVVGKQEGAWKEPEPSAVDSLGMCIYVHTLIQHIYYIICVPECMCACHVQCEPVVVRSGLDSLELEP